MQRVVSFDELVSLSDERLKNFLSPFFSSIPSPELKIAMEYMMSNGGKRIRPLLVYATGSIFAADFDDLDGPAAAIEMIHTFSLIHDDLPCMDNADLRRGKPSCHIAFNEALAVLAGDALQTLAFQILGTYNAHPSIEKRLQMINLLAHATGPYGMTAGQALDMTLLSDPNLSIDLLTEIYRLKTGSLLSASILLGHLASGDDNELNQAALQQFGHAIGLAFQLQDDLLDMTQSEKISGKRQNIDIINNKHTLASRLGIIETKDKIAKLYETALSAINYLGGKAQLLRDVTAYLLQREANS